MFRSGFHPPLVSSIDILVSRGGNLGFQGGNFSFVGVETGGGGNPAIRRRLLTDGGVRNTVRLANGTDRCSPSLIFSPDPHPIGGLWRTDAPIAFDVVRLYLHVAPAC